MAFFTELSCRALNFAVGSNCDFFIGKLFATLAVSILIQLQRSRLKQKRIDLPLLPVRAW